MNGIPIEGIPIEGIPIEGIPMSDLRSNLIRLASEKPELRQHLLPLLKQAGRPTAEDLDRVLASFLRTLQSNPGVASAVINDFSSESQGAEVEVFVYAKTPADPRDLERSKNSPGRIAMSLKAQVKRLVDESDGTLRLISFVTPLQGHGPIPPDLKDRDAWTGQVTTYTSPATIIKFYQRYAFQITLRVITDKSQMVSLSNSR